MAAANGGWNPAWLRFAAVKGRRVDVVKVCPALEVDLFERVRGVQVVRKFLATREAPGVTHENNSRPGVDFS